MQGTNGSGKSTLSKLSSFLYEPTEGQIFCNDMISTAYHPRRLMDKVVLVTNEDIIFNDTILFNMTLGQPVEMAQIIEYTKALNLYEFINTKAEQFDFVVHENGRNLSTGQRKKLLLLRGLFSPSEIVILDEIFYGMDKESKIKAEQIIEFTSHKTFVVISHEDINHIRFNKHFQIANGELLAK